MVVGAGCRRSIHCGRANANTCAGLGMTDMCNVAEALDAPKNLALMKAAMGEQALVELDEFGEG